MQQRSAAITLTTDFGTQDAFVGVMKGVILGIAPEAAIVDITHEVPPGDVAAGAYHLSNAWRHFPHGSVHLVVVDPGVGSDRRALAATAGGHRFVAPDNGVLTPVLDEAGCRAHEITVAHYFARSPSPTFHGRDVFAPVAARLARAGIAIENLGSPVTDPVRLDLDPPRIDGGTIHARVLHVDRFGNAILNVEGVHLRTAASGNPDPSLRAEIGVRTIERFVTHYAAARSSLCFLINSDGRLEIALPGGSAADHLGLTRGAPVTLEVR